MKEGVEGKAKALELATVNHVFALGRKRIMDNLRELRTNTDDTMRELANELDSFVDTLPNSDYFIPERTPVESVRGTGKQPDNDAIQQFGEDTVYPAFRKAFDQS